MKDPIERQAAVDALMEILDRPKHAEFLYTDEICKTLNELPSVEPGQKTGEWIKYGVPRCGEQHYKCTSCGYYINFGQWGELYTKEFKYCPNCGCKMERGEQDEQR